MGRRGGLDHLVALELDALRDAELAALALGISLPVAGEWLRDRDAPAARALERRCAAWGALRERLTRRPVAAPVVSDVTAAVALLSPGLAELTVEELHVVGLDARNRVLGRARVARGAVNQVMATAREVFRPLVLIGAAQAIVAHNHPSGDPTPSDADAELTARLGVAGELLGVPLVDHLVVARGGYHSFAQAGELLAPRGRRRRRGNVGMGIGIG